MAKIIYLLLLTFGLSCSQNATTAQSKLSPDQFEAMLQKDANVQLLDVRTPEEFKSGHIAGAKNLNFHDKDFAQQILKLDKNKPIMVYCAKGGRSASAAEKLTGAGFPKVFDLTGGMSAWKAAGKQSEK